MDNNINNTITASEFVCIAVGVVINLDILSLPRYTASISWQDAWISTAIGGIYPLYLCILCYIVSKKHPNEDILSLSNKYFGKIPGNILNLIFSLQFIILTAFSCSGYASVNRVYSVPFLSKYKIILVTLGVSSYFALKKIKTIGKISSYVFFLTILLILLPLFNLNKGNITNLMPFMGSGYKKIFLGSIKTIYSYAGMEVIFLLYPFISNKNKTKFSILLSPLLIILIYTFIVFITLYIC